ncbi:hypothetical protein ANAPC5_01403 [Anaplasma phagocytophilum]|nr:hypothetical protein ANAPC5_01403 [Anaplasma phagocytophilum]
MERCSGLLKNRFWCLQRHWTLHYHPSIATTTIMTARAVLHNACLALSEPKPESGSDPEKSELESEPSSEGSVSGGERLAPANLPVGLSDRALRQRLVARFETRCSRAPAQCRTRQDGSPTHEGRRHEGGPAQKDTVGVPLPPSPR